MNWEKKTALEVYEHSFVKEKVLEDWFGVFNALNEFTLEWPPQRR